MSQDDFVWRLDIPDSTERAGMPSRTYREHGGPKLCKSEILCKQEIGISTYARRSTAISKQAIFDWGTR